MNIYTYHAPSPEIASWYDPDSMLELWKSEWAKRGHTPIVLTQQDAESHPKFPRFKELIAQVNTTNPRSYEEACWFRWFAIAARGGGCMSDTDVLPNTERHPMEFMDGGLTVLSLDSKECGQVCPCLVVGIKSDYELLLDLMTNAVSMASHHRHYSDQSFFRQYPRAFEVSYVCATYAPGAAPRLYTHYKTDALNRPWAGGPTKAQQIQSLRH